MEKKTAAKKPAAKKAAAPRAAKKPAAAKKAEAPKTAQEAAPVALTAEGTVHAIGRRKEAVAQVRVGKGTGKIVVNGKPYEGYFTVEELQWTVLGPLKAAAQDANLDVSVLVKGGGIRGQAEATRLGIARALTEMSDALRPTMRKMGYLTRDARVKERKKYGLKSARRAPQFSKR